MRSCVFFLTLLLLSCNSPQNNSADSLDAAPIHTGPISDSEDPPKKEIVNNGLAWRGTINQKIPVFVHFQQDDQIVVGTITYLNTKAKDAIKLIGTFDKESGYYLREFDQKGNITGIISGNQVDDSFTGRWYAPGRENKWTLYLTRSDTLIPSPKIKADMTNIFGNYYYQFGEAGYQGSLQLSPEVNDKLSFSLSSMTQAPARNMADISATVELNNAEFLYRISEQGDETDCTCKVKFYKDFAYVKYTKDNCLGIFGHRATVEGVFLKLYK